MKQYLDALRTILEQGIERPNRTGIDTKAVFGMQMRYNMADGFPAVTTKKLAFKSVVGELLCFIRAKHNKKDFVEENCHIWNENADAWRDRAPEEGDLGRIYGVQWRHWRTRDGEIDQLKQVITSLQTDPCSRRHIVTAWNPAELDDMALPPCHAFFQFFVAGSRLSLQLYQRSADMFLGVPFNIASYSLLLHMVAQVTGLVAHEFIHSLGDAHIYENHIDQVREQLTRTPHELPKLWINPQVKDIDSFDKKDFALENYHCDPPIPAKMAV